VRAHTLTFGGKPGTRHLGETNAAACARQEGSTQKVRGFLEGLGNGDMERSEIFTDDQEKETRNKKKNTSGKETRTRAGIAPTITVLGPKLKVAKFLTVHWGKKEERKNLNASGMG